MAEPVTKRPFAVFDIDGTIIRWQLYHAIADELARAGCIGAIEYETVRAARLKWKNRQNSNSYHVYEQTLINVVDAALTAISVEQFKAACATVIAQYKNQVYTFTRDLIKQLQSEGYLLFAISASQSDIVQLLAEYYSFDDFGGSIYEIEAGFYTGKKELLKAERKPEFLKALVEKHNASWQGSIGVGDSESDIPLLSVVEKPIAFNPSQLLFDRAKAERWRVVVERKNMIYDLKDKDGTFVLA